MSVASVREGSAMGGHTYLEERVAKLQFGRTIGGRHETPSGVALSGNGVFKLLNVVDDRCEVGAEDGVDRTDAETRTLDVGEGRCSVGGETWY